MPSINIGGRPVPLVIPKKNLDLVSREEGGQYHVPVIHYDMPLVTGTLDDDFLSSDFIIMPITGGTIS